MISNETVYKSKKKKKKKGGFSSSSTSHYGLVSLQITAGTGIVPYEHKVIISRSNHFCTSTYQGHTEQILIV